MARIGRTIEAFQSLFEGLAQEFPIINQIISLKMKSVNKRESLQGVIIHEG